MSDRIQSVAEKLGVDRDALTARFREEREKRLRTDYVDQYRRAAEEFDHLLADPFVDGEVEREPLTDEVDVVIIGAGFGGMLCAARLRQQGVEGIRIIEEAGDFGGTWYWNRYPGAQCDIESYCYLPLLDELGYTPKERYSYANEIFDVAQMIAEKYDLRASTCFRTRVDEARWDDDIARWVITTNRGDEMRARFVITALGSLHRAKLPGASGLEDFQGKVFHTSRWDYDYTGGSPSDTNLDRLGDKKVAVIGTGCTAIQCVPYLAAGAEHLYVFQRTPASVDERLNAPTDPEWAASLEPGWQERRRRNFDATMTFQPVEEVLVQDGWTAQFRGVSELIPELDPPPSEEELAALIEVVDLKYTEDIRRRVDETVSDPETREKLKAWYRQFCKRATFSDEYLPTFNRPNVTLVDTSETKGVERVTEKGIVAGGVEYEVDCIVYATGFDLTGTIKQRSGVDIVGEDGRTLNEYWSDGLATFQGFSIRNFPNYFISAFGLQG
ncbi:MAG: NAD(P)/FAD-dependent oxidoreductase, partial [Myxococcales bacterium]|nr:NAD(P)/FAD-dependent oxidoreductase [Myxococcales bacterium]